MRSFSFYFLKICFSLFFDWITIIITMFIRNYIKYWSYPTIIILAQFTDHPIFFCKILYLDLENVPPFVFVPKSAKTKKLNVLSFSTKGVVRSKSFFIENEISSLSFLTLFSIVFFACKEINLINKEALEMNFID